MSRVDTTGPLPSDKIALLGYAEGTRQFAAELERENDRLRAELAQALEREDCLIDLMRDCVGYLPSGSKTERLVNEAIREWSARGGEATHE